MNDPTARALIERLADELDQFTQLLTDDRTARHDLAVEARAALARWGRTAAQPVPVAERLPGPEDCDAEEQVWQWDEPSDAWVLYTSNGIGIRHDQGLVDYWLPAHALPLPTRAHN